MKTFGHRSKYGNPGQVSSTLLRRKISYWISQGVIKVGIIFFFLYFFSIPLCLDIHYSVFYAFFLFLSLICMFASVTLCLYLCVCISVSISTNIHQLFWLWDVLLFNWLTYKSAYNILQYNIHINIQYINTLLKN